ncbi:hypothetical protein BDM02DRAFT_3121028 [Thelephora ganbajun]|uniref:Uncharacterized protein n=1 Tax=Thelephora ganbajun TaxID=370292 RepID=A0ACB6Z5F1_THEGA|nr:hypothetical protein BDM02DRAFT_3121028 [Thelephora ganbajun]
MPPAHLLGVELSGTLIFVVSVIVVMYAVIVIKHETAKRSKDLALRLDWLSEVARRDFVPRHQ